MALTNAESQRRFRERRAAGEPVRTVAVARTPPKDRRPRPKQWTDAVAVLRRQLDKTVAGPTEKSPIFMGDVRDAKTEAPLNWRQRTP